MRTMTTESVENLVLGGGEAGKYMAWELAKQGQPVVVVERGLIGGSCPNIACLPSKNIIQSARVAHLVMRAEAYGLRTGEVALDMAQVRERKREMVDGMIAIHEKKYDLPKLELVLGEGRLVGPRTVEVQFKDGGTRTFSAARLFLNLGSRAAIPSIPGIREAPPTHVEALELGHLPSHLIVLGGGYVGIEFAQAMRRFGSRVTVLHTGEHLLSREDPDVGDAVQRLFEEDGIEVLTRAETTRVEGRSGDHLRLTVKTPEGTRALEGSHLLVAAGRTPNTQGIGLEEAGIALDDRGYVRVDERLRTRAESVWAMGDCAGSPQFTHIALDDFRVVNDTVLKGGTRTTADRQVPSCAFIDPQLARIGMDETQAARQGRKVRVARIQMSSVLRARAMVETRGFMKMLIDPESEQILGFTMLGGSAGEVLAVVQTAMLGKLPYTALRDGIFTHPTMAEGLNVLLASVPEAAVPSV